MTTRLKLDFRKWDLRKLDWRKLSRNNRQPGAALLGLAFDAGRLEGVALRRTNGAVEVKKTLSISLSLDPLTDAPELVGREIRKGLDAAEIRERRCAVCIPLNWALTLTTKLPDLPEADLDSFLQIEAERGFPYGPDALMLSCSRYRTPGGEPYATLVAIPRDHVTRLEAALEAAQLRPVSFSLGVAALQRAEAESSDGVLALAPGESSIGLQISCGGGVAVLRTVEGAFELEGGESQLQADQVAREVRITLGQLPSDVREAVRRVRIFGRSDTADELAEQLGPRLEALGIKVEQVKQYPPDEFGLQIAAGTAVTPALSLAVRHLSAQAPTFEFLPPKVSAWQQLAERYSSGKLAQAGAAAGGIALLVVLAFFIQQVQLLYWQAKWARMKTRVTELEDTQQQIKKFRPWFDDSCRSLSVLRRLTEAFPEDGTVSAKTVEMREPATVTCSGTARDNAALLKTLDKLRGAKEVANVHIEQTRGAAPMQFTFDFQWGQRGGQ